MKMSIKIIIWIALCMRLASAAPANESLLLYWPLDEAMGEVAEDAGSLGVNGILGKGSRHHRGPSFHPGQGWINGAVNLGSRNGVRSESEIAFPESWTWSFVYQGAGGARFAFCGPVHVDLGAADARISIAGLGTIVVERLTPRRWEQMAVVVEPGVATVYINGREAGKAEKEGWKGSGEANLRFEADMRGGFSGLVDEVRLYSQALPPAAIAQLAEGLYNPEAKWISAYTADQQKLVHAGHLNKPGIESLIELGAPDIATMIRILENGESREVRVQAAFSLGVIWNDAAVKALVAALEAKDTAVLAQVVESLGRIAPAEQLQALIDRMGHADATVRAKARQAVAGYGETVAPSLRQALESSIQFVAEGAAALLTQWDAEPLDAAEALRRQIALRQWAAVRKGEFEDLSPLSKALSRDTADVAQAAATELVQRGEVSVPYLLRELAEGSNAGPVLAAQALGRIGDATAADALAGRLNSDDLTLQQACAEALRLMAGRQHVNALAATLESRNAASREAAAAALANIGQPALARTARILRRGSIPARLSAATVVGRIGGEGAIKPLLDALDDPDDRVRAMAVRALGGFPDAPLDALSGALSDEGWLVRREAVIALRRQKSHAAFQRLVHVQDDPYPLVRQALKDEIK